MGNVTETEIKEQHNAWAGVLDDYKHNRSDVFDFIEELEDTELIFIGCGTSYYLALSGASVYRGVTGEAARAVTSSDVFLYSPTLFSRNGQTLGIPISRSGKTTETIWATNFINEHLGISTLALSCNQGSKLVQIADRELVSAQAAEKSVVMTRSFTSMLLLIQLLAAKKSRNETFLSELVNLPTEGAALIPKCDDLAKEIAENASIQYFTFLGQGPYYGLACEAMLKMKEMSLSVSDAYHSMEFRHGPISILNQQTLVVLMVSESCQEQETKILKEVKTLGAKALVICERADRGIRDNADYLVELNSGFGDYARLNLYMPMIQLLGYYRAVKKDLDPDNPRHLTQVVVLE